MEKAPRRSAVRDLDRGALSGDRGDRPPDLPARIRALEAELAACHAELDAALVRAIATVAGDRAFAAIELWRHAATVSPALGQACAAAGVTSARRLGKRLERLQGRALGGLRLERLGAKTNCGLIWIVTVIGDSHLDR
jgi:hypothetical protein